MAVQRPDLLMHQLSTCLALGRASNVPFVGLCHGVQTTLDLIAGYLGIKDKNEITYTWRARAE